MNDESQSHPTLPSKPPRWFFPGVIALAGILTVPAWFSGLHLDDWQQQDVIRGEYEFSDGSPTQIEFFTFATGNPDINRRLIDRGVLPWWTNDRLRLRFLRPISVLTHQLDLLIWPDTLELSHGHSILWFLVSVFAASLVYRQCGVTTLGVCLATLFFAIDDVHATTIAWLANRNHLISGSLLLFAFHAHTKWQTEDNSRYGILSIVLFSCGLLAAELAVAYGGLVVAWAVTLHPGSVRRRITSILPGLCVGILWLFLYQKGNFGARFSGQYIDPAGHPVEFLAAIVERVPIFFAVFFGASSADVYSYGGAVTHTFIWCSAAAAVGFFGSVIVWLGRSDHHIRFWSLSTFLVVLPICAGNFMDRSLLIASFTAHGLIVRLLGLAREFWKSRQTSNSKWRPVSGKAALVGFVVVYQLAAHTIGAAALLPLRIQAFNEYRSSIERAIVSLDRLDPLQNRDLIIVNPPDTLFVWHLPEIRRYFDRSLPRRVRILSSCLISMELERPNDNTIVMRPEQPFIRITLADMYRNTDLTSGWERSLTGVTINVADVSSTGDPQKVVFTFDQSVDSSELVWCEWRGGEFVAFTPPRPGTTIHIPARLNDNWIVTEPVRKILGF